MNTNTLVRTNFIRSTRDWKSSPTLSYAFDDNMDRTLISYRLFLYVYLDQHMNKLYKVKTSIGDMISACGYSLRANHYRESSVYKNINQALQWMVDNKYITIDGSVDNALLDKYKLNECFDINILDGFDIMRDKRGAATEPFITITSSEYQRIVGMDNHNIVKAMHIMTYIKTKISWSDPKCGYAATEELKNITGISAPMVSKITAELCEIGVLHREMLNKNSSQTPPYLYVADVTGWELDLRAGADDANRRRGGVAYKIKKKEKEKKQEKPQESQPEVKPVEKEAAKEIKTDDVKPTTQTDTKPDDNKGLNIVHVDNDVKPDEGGYDNSGLIDTPHDLTGLKSELYSTNNINQLYNTVQKSGILDTLTREEYEGMKQKIAMKLNEELKDVGLDPGPMSFMEQVHCIDVIIGRRIVNSTYERYDSNKPLLQ